MDENGQIDGVFFIKLILFSRMDLLPGIIALTTSLGGFSSSVTEIKILERPSTQSITLSLSPLLDAGIEMRIVLNWGRLPKDLDLHVFQIDRSKNITSFHTDLFRHSKKAKCQIFWSKKAGCSGLRLDVDNTRGKRHF